MVLFQIIQGIQIFIRIVQVALIIYCILTWIVSRDSEIMRFLGRFIEPLLWPIQKLLYRFTRNPLILSFSPLILSVLLDLLSRLLSLLAYRVL